MQLTPIGVLSVGSTPGFVATQNYTYDELNRLKSATENNTPTGGSSAQSWKQTYLFDRFGNRTFDTSSGATTTLPSGFNAHIYNPTVDPSNNQFSGGQDYAYDLAGNITQDATGKKFVYDGENKQISFGTGGSSTNGGTYFYDGDGHRVKKIVGTEVTVFVYDAGGQMVAEYSTTAPSSPQVNFLTADTLGTPRVNTDASGNLIARHDYMPFGEEIFTPGVRLISIGYAVDQIRQKFTGKPHDGETALSLFGARYYFDSSGRFLSPDPVQITSFRMRDPQRVNQYAYCRDNPLKLVDEDGREVIPANARSAAQLAADLDKNLTPAEAANIKIEAGKNVAIVNPAAIDLSKASLGYRDLMTAIAPGKVFHYNAVSEGDTITTSDGRPLSWSGEDGVSGGATVPIDTDNLRTATVVDIFVPTSDGPEVLNNDGGFIPFPRDIISIHELFGHGLCGPGQCAINVENQFRTLRGLPLRSGTDHESLPGEAPGNTPSHSFVVNSTGSTPGIITNDYELPTVQIPLRPIQPLLQPSPGP